jgi:LPS sulfotransferase NodH
LAEVTRFVILAAPRTGSNWLCTLLDSHPEILCHHEIFNPEGVHFAQSRRDGELDFGTLEDRDRNPLQVLDLVWRESLGHRVVGFKINRGQESRVLRRVLEDRDVLKIVIRRMNCIRTFVSEQIAEITGRWESNPGSEVSRELISIQVDPAELRQHVLLNQRYYHEIYRSLAALGQTALEVCYEDLGCRRVHRRALAFLGATPSVQLQTGTRKQSIAELHELIANFDDLERALRGSDLEKDLYTEDPHQQHDEEA